MAGAVRGGEKAMGRGQAGEGFCRDLARTEDTDQVAGCTGYTETPSARPGHGLGGDTGREALQELSPSCQAGVPWPPEGEDLH